MRRTCLILTLVALFAGTALAGHALNSPMATTNPGDFWISGNADCDGTFVFDGVCTFNADAIFTLDVSVGADLTVTDDAVVTDSLYVGGNLTVAADLEGARVWLGFANGASNATADVWLSTDHMLTSTARGRPAPCAGSARGYAVRYNIDSYTPGAYAVTRFYIDGAKTFADSFYIDATGWHDSQDGYARDTYTFAAGDHISVQFDIDGTLQYDAPVVTLDLQLDD